MACPVCGRLYCDCSPMERGQTLSEMLEDALSPHIIDGRRTKRVTPKEYEKYTGRKWIGGEYTLERGKRRKSIKDKKQEKK